MASVRLVEGSLAGRPAGPGRRLVRLDARLLRRHALRHGPGRPDGRPGHGQGDGRTAGLADPRRFGRRRPRFRRRRRPLRPPQGPDGQHPHLLGLHRGLRLRHERRACWPSSAIFLGLGMGGEWASGAALVSETWPAEHRGKALGIVQSSWAVGYAAAAAVAALVLPVWGWRGVFFVGVMPGLLHALDPEAGRGAGDLEGRPARRRRRVRAGFGEIFGRRRLRLTLLITADERLHDVRLVGFQPLAPGLPVACPSDRAAWASRRGRCRGLVIFMQAGMWLGYITFGFISDRLRPQEVLRRIPHGRRRLHARFTPGPAQPLVLLLLGPFVAFFGTGYFTGFGALTAEIYPTAVRATAQGITYNTGRIVSAAAPFVVGSLAQTRGFGFSFTLIAAAFLAAAVFWAGIPETKGKALE
ncbi:MAG: MFS transporter [Desulfobacterales bacterium]|nr:MFS transporter [Desulfobacterales bacterium]